MLSRFDMIFIVRDEHNEQRDRTMAKHVMNIHMNRANDTTATGEFDIEQMKRYISFCKSRCAPRLSPEAAEKLSSHFVALRKQVAQVERDNDERSSIPITVRQLEAIVRISESLAKVTLSPTVGEEHVDEAMRLFRSSTMDAVQAGNVEGMTRGELAEECQKLEREIRRRLPIGWSTSYGKLRHEFVESQATPTTRSSARSSSRKARRDPLHQPAQDAHQDRCVSRTHAIRFVFVSVSVVSLAFASLHVSGSLSVMHIVSGSLVCEIDGLQRLQRF